MNPQTSMIAGLPPVHPGALLREDVLPAIKINKAEIARRLHVSRQTLYDILNEKQPISANMALRLGKLLGNGPNVWLGMQQAYDLKIAEGELADELQQIEPIPAEA